MKQRHETEPTCIELKQDELDQLITEIKKSSLSEKSKDLVVKALSSFAWLTLQLEKNSLSLKKLKRLFFGSKTEKEKKPKGSSKSPDDKGSEASKDPSSEKEPEPDKPKEPKPDKPKVPRHGKNGQANFTNAEKVNIPHPFLNAQDPCPECEEGRLYDYPPAAVLRIVGQAPLSAKIFELARRRCGSCQELFTAPLPEEAGPERNHASAKAMVAVLNYGSGMPFYKLEGLQKNMETPVPDSTQFDMA